MAAMISSLANSKFLRVCEPQWNEAHGSAYFFEKKACVYVYIYTYIFICMFMRVYQAQAH